MKRSALLLIDVQLGMFLRSKPLFRGEELLSTLEDLLTKARAQKAAVVFVQHAGGSGHFLEKGTRGGSFHPRVSPCNSEHVVEKRYCDTFLETGLEPLLRRLDVLRLVVAGMQTEYCIDTTCRQAFSRGFEVELLLDAHTTFDCEWLSAEQIIRHHNEVLGDGFASLKRATDVQF